VARNGDAIIATPLLSLLIYLIMPHDSYYTLLGLGPEATPSQIETACRQMLRLYQSSGASPERLAELREIQTVLCDPQRRAAYNATLKPAGPARTPAADPGKGLRWLGLLAALVLPLGGIIWWANRPVAGKPVVSAPVAMTEAAPAINSSDSQQRDQNMGQAQKKLHELQTLQNRKYAIDSQLARYRVEAENQRNESDDEQRVAEVEDLNHERAWIEDRIATINRVELKQAMYGELPPAQRYPGR